MLFKMPGGPSLSDWTSLSPFGIAWELTTLSFVVDWVADIGGYLSLWENNALFSRHFVNGYKTRSMRESYTYHERRNKPLTVSYLPNGSVSAADGGNAVRDAYSVFASLDRLILTSLPVPAGVTVKVRFGEMHQLDSLALIYQIFVKKLKSH
jgi:hypothetical protein